MKSLSVLLSLIAVSLLLAGSSSASPEEVAKAYEQGRKAEADRDFKTALEHYDRVMDLDEDYEDAFERWEAATELAFWQEALEGEPGALDLVRLGEIYLQFARIEEEREAYEQALALDSNCSDAHGHLALSHYTAPGGSLVTVIEETAKFLATSPRREQLGNAIADFEVYGRLRILRAVLGEELNKAASNRKAGRHGQAAEILEAAVARDLPDAYRTALYATAGQIRFAGGDADGARAAFTKALEHSPCAYVHQARLGLAILAVKAGDLPGALAHLRAAVAEGSGVCDTIEEQRNKAFKPLFTASDEVIRKEMEDLANMDAGDEPFRQMIRNACAKGEEEGKLVLLYWYGPYCPYVMAMEDRLAHPDVQKVLEKHYILVRIDYGSHHRAMSLDAEYGDVFERQGVPSFMVLDYDGRIDSIQTDRELMGAPDRCFDVEKILTWLRSTATENE